MPSHSTLPAASWRTAKALYEQAVELPLAAREAFLAAAEVDETIRGEVRSLLAYDPNADQAGEAQGGFMSRSPVLDTPQFPDRIGERLGPWQIVAPMGAGGMGDVFEARRADGSFEGRAAVKLLKRGLDSVGVLQRFNQERQSLARMQHPHIATLLDAGLSADGLPFFVMEYVDGRAIDVAAAGVTVKERLALFLQLADAVAYAHRNLLVHRDLKPGNVLVTSQGQVKLLDFGIAKALDPSELSDDSMGNTTEGTQRPFTPQYASPEQVRGERVSTSTDIYSLGVLLYQLLTGLRPTGRSATTPAEMARSVLEEEPPLPSSLSPQLVQDAHWLATRKHLKGDLDNILLMALEKPIERRYSSVEAMAQDVRNFLSGHPVSARAKTWGYVTVKLIRRHRLAAALTFLLLISLVVGVAVSTWQANQARSRLVGIKALTREAVFRFGDAVTYVPGGMAIKTDLLKQLIKVLDKLVETSGDDVDLRADAAQAYARLADVEFNENSAAQNRAQAGQQHADRALELARSALDDKLSDANFVIWYWRALGTRARLQRANGEAQAAFQTMGEVRPVLTRGIAVAERERSADAVLALRVERARSRHFLSQILFNTNVAHLNRPQDALAELAAARAELQELEAQHPDPEISYLLGSVDGQTAIVHEAQEELALALPMAERAMLARRASLAALPQDVEYRDALVTESTNLGRILLRLQRDRDALAATTVGWDMNQQLAKEHASDTDNRWTRRASALATHHGRALRRAGRPAAALPVLEQALTFWSQASHATPNSLDAARAVAWMNAERAQAMQALGQAAQSRAVAGEAYRLYQPPTGDSYQRRSGLLVQAQLAMTMAGASKGQEVANWNTLARQALDEAAALRPLAGDNLHWSQVLQASP